MRHKLCANWNTSSTWNLLATHRNLQSSPGIAQNLLSSEINIRHSGKQQQASKELSYWAEREGGPVKYFQFAANPHLPEETLLFYPERTEKKKTLSYFLVHFPCGKNHRGKLLPGRGGRNSAVIIIVYLCTFNYNIVIRPVELFHSRTAAASYDTGSLPPALLLLAEPLKMYESVQKTVT